MNVSGSETAIRDWIARHGESLLRARLRAWQFGQYQRAHRWRVSDFADEFLFGAARSGANLQSRG